MFGLQNIGIGQHSLRGHEVLGRKRIACAEPVAVGVDRLVGGLPPRIPRQQALLLVHLVVAAEVDLVVVSTGRRVPVEIEVVRKGLPVVRGQRVDTETRSVSLPPD